MCQQRKKDIQRSGRSGLQSRFPQTLVKHSVNNITTIIARMSYFLLRRYIIRVSCDTFLNQADMTDLSLYRASLDSYQDILPIMNWHTFDKFPSIMKLQLCVENIPENRLVRELMWNVMIVPAHKCGELQGYNMLGSLSVFLLRLLYTNRNLWVQSDKLHLKWLKGSQELLLTLQHAVLIFNKQSVWFSLVAGLSLHNFRTISPVLVKRMKNNIFLTRRQTRVYLFSERRKNSWSQFLNFWAQVNSKLPNFASERQKSWTILKAIHHTP